MNLSRAWILACGLLGVLACTPDAPEDDGAASASDDALVQRASDHWFYGGPLPVLEQPRVFASLKGHTARVTGYLPRGVELPSLPHVRTTQERGRTRVDVVYPIATAIPTKPNAQPGVYAFYEVRPYRPDGPALTTAEGWHDVPWGGFPFFAYDNGIAFHGPISARGARPAPGPALWYLERGPVSGGCNRMLGEHIVELTHILGVSMRKVYAPNRSYRPTTTADVTILADYDTVEGKFVDVDYPTWSGVTRPAAVHGDAAVTMFGSWTAAEAPDGSDLPPRMQWQGGVRGKWYDFGEHARRDWICATAEADLAGLRQVAQSFGGTLPASFCEKRACVLDAIRSGNAPRARTLCAFGDAPAAASGTRP